MIVPVLFVSVFFSISQLSLILNSLNYNIHHSLFVLKMCR